jgi:hypothetical protein
MFTYMPHGEVLPIFIGVIILGIALAYGVTQRRRKSGSLRSQLPPDSPRYGGSEPADPDLKHQDRQQSR